MSDIFWTQFWGGLPPTIAAISALLVVLYSARKAAEVAKATEKAAADKANTLIEKTTEIHAVTNGHLSEMTKQLEVAKEKIAGMETLITSMVDANKATEVAAATAAQDVAKALATQPPETKLAS